MSVKPTHTSKPKRIFWLFLVPLLCLIIMQALLSFGTVFLSGAFSTIRNYTPDRLEQVTETRSIILENDMTQRWTALEEEYEVAGQMLADRLAGSGMSMDDFLRDPAAQEEYFTDLFPTWGYMLRKNSTTGAFIILGRPDAAQGGTLKTLYIRDSDPDTNPADYSDLFMTIGPSRITKEYRVPFDIYWRTDLNLKPYGAPSSSSRKKILSPSQIFSPQTFSTGTHISSPSSQGTGSPSKPSAVKSDIYSVSPSPDTNVTRPR